MIWALLAILFLGGGGAAPIVEETKRIEKLAPHVVQEKARLSSIKASMKELEKLSKTYKAQDKKAAEALLPLFDERLVDRNAVNALIDERHAASREQEEIFLDMFLKLRSQFTKEEWAGLYGGGASKGETAVQ